MADPPAAWNTPLGTIRQGMRVLAPDGSVLGTVAGMEGEELLLDPLTPGEAPAFVTLTLVDGVGAEGVLLSGRGDATFGLGAEP